ncbi:MAG TPA: hypothetical protein VMF30_12755, partial [Pirellulales bacterium]|nr:hypothetical protein [Pirellulales bacterium]
SGRVSSLIAAKKTPEEMVTDLYLASFGRMPQTVELTEAANSLRGSKDLKAGLTDLVWVMLNSKEFLFNH